MKRLSPVFAMAFLLAMPSAMGLDFVPLEVQDPPVNGNDQVEDPAGLRSAYGFGDRPSKKMVEHSDTIALLDEDGFRYFETPHIQWANAYNQTPIRVLWVVNPKWGLRDNIEIRQRSNFEITCLMLSPTFRVHPDDEGMNAFFKKRYDEILSRDYDVIVLRHYTPRVWRSETLHPVISSVFKRIEDKVRAGCGLICMLANERWSRGPDGGNGSIPDDNAAYSALSPIYYGGGGMDVRGPVVRTDAPSPVTSAVSFAMWPPCEVSEASADESTTVLATSGGHPVVGVGTYGEGRVVGFHYGTALTGQTGLVPDWDTEAHPRFGDYYESVYAVWLRALAWAAGKPPSVAMEAPDVTECKSGIAPEVSITLRREEYAPAGPLSLRYVLTDAFGDRLVSNEMAVTLGEEPVTVTPPLPVLQASGDYRLDLWAVAEGKTANWGTAGIRVKGGPALSCRRQGKPPRPGETVVYQIDTKGAAGTLRILGVDSNDRVFVDRSHPITGDGPTEVEVETRLSKLPTNRLFFTLHDPATKAILARSATKLYLPWIGLNSLNGKFMFASYGQTTEAVHLQRYTGLLYRAAGLNAIYFNNHSRERLEQAADQGLYAISGRSWGFRQKGFSKIHHYLPNKPENREKIQTEIGNDVVDIEAFGSVSRVLDDETWFAYTVMKDGELRGAQLTQDEWTMKLFRERMQEKYKTIDALNEMWGTDFKNFDEVRVIEEDEIKGKENPSGWLEFREYMNWTYAVRYYGWVSKEHEKALGDDYRAGCGAPHWTTSEGGPTYRGGDMAKMSGHMRFMMLYGGGSPGAAFVGQPGGQKYDPPMNWKDYGAWSHLLTGADALWYYFGNAIIGSELAWRRHAVWMKEAITDIEQGCGELVSGASGSPSEVKMLSSSMNQHMGWLYAKREDAWSALRLGGGQPASARTFSALMANLFVRRGGLTEESIIEGGLDDCKLLFLPQQLNMSDDAVKAIRDYVREGGIVVADILPATRYEMGKPRGNSALADVFGVDFSSARIHKEREQWYSIGVETPKDATDLFSRELIWLPNNVICLDIKPTTAKAHAKILSKEGKGTEGCLINHFGKGKALLFNFVYTGLNDESLVWHRRFGEALLKWAGIQPEARIVDPVTQAPLPYRPLYSYRRGKAVLLGSIRGSFGGGGNPQLYDRGRMFTLSDKAMFTWSGARHAYDVRARRYLGFGESATIELPSYRGRLLALLPYKVSAVALTAPERVAAGTEASLDVTIKTDGEAPGEHVVYFHVVSPRGVHRTLYSTARVAPEGHASFSIPFALNDPAGAWTVVARDVMTGVEAKATIQLSEREPAPVEK